MNNNYNNGNQNKRASPKIIDLDLNIFTKDYQDNNNTKTNNFNFNSNNNIRNSISYTSYLNTNPIQDKNPNLKHSYYQNFNSTLSTSINTQDLSIIDQISRPHPQIKSILTKRMNSLKILEKTWTKGKINETIKELCSIKDRGVCCDFFNSAFMSNEYNKDCLKLSDTINLLPLIEKLVSSKYESNFRCGIKMVCMIYDMYSDKIKEYKMNKIKMDTIESNFDECQEGKYYEILFEFFKNIKNIDTIRKRDLNEDKNLQCLLQEMDDFFEFCHINK